MYQELVLTTSVAAAALWSWCSTHRIGGCIRYMRDHDLELCEPTKEAEDRIRWDQGRGTPRRWDTGVLERTINAFEGLVSSPCASCSAF